MQVDIKKIDKLKHKLKIELNGKEFNDEKKEFYTKASKQLKVPGFRPGKAPFDLIEKHHKKALQDSFIKEKLPTLYQAAVEKSSISPVGLPKVSDVKMTSEALSFTAEIEVQPEIKVDESSYKGMKIKTKETKPSKKQVDEAIKKFKDEIKKITDQKMDEEKLARWASYPNMNSFREAVSVQIELENLQERKRFIEKQIRDNLLNLLKPEVPQSDIERYQAQLVNQQIQQLKQQGIKQEEIDKYKDNFTQKLKPVAETEVKFFYILAAIAKKEKIKEDQQMANAVIGLILSEANFS